MSQQPYQIVLTTCPDQPNAERIARALVEEGLAACVNILPAMHSIYKWQGKIESASEHLLLVKSMSHKFPSIRDRILDLHPYELPEIVAVPIADGFARYLAWLENPDQIS